MKNIERIMFTFLLLFPFVEMLGQGNGMWVTATVEQPKGKGDFRVFGRVADAATKSGIADAKILLYDEDGTVSDTVSVNSMGGMGPAIYNFRIERTDTVVVFDIVAPGYNMRTVTFPLGKIGTRERSREIPITYLERAPRQLGEVTVVASKVKFYNKGDTIVYNADAFQTADGSMLDALISQLPGTKIDGNGQITVNGEFVETLLLNGKHFFNGNKQIMLENIGAYTVKNIEVYKGQTDMEKWMGDERPPSHLTMDVKLKKEYSNGLLVNAQGGGGTNDRYLGRLFASWFSSTTNISLVANLNNLNDNRRPGMDQSWSPDKMPQGTRRYQTVGLNVTYTHPENKGNYMGYVDFSGIRNDLRTSTDCINFFPDGKNTYDYGFSGGKSRNISLNSQHIYSYRTSRFTTTGQLIMRYDSRHDDASDISAAFDSEQTGLTARILEAIYSDGSSTMLGSVINRSISRTRQRGREWGVDYKPSVVYKMPGTGDFLMINLGVKYDDERMRNWRDFTINYGDNAVAAYKRRQFVNDSPNRKLALTGGLDYRMNINDWHLSLGYNYNFESRDRNKSTFELDRLADMGVFGVLPVDYMSALDPNNSYVSHQYNNKHSLTPALAWYPTMDNVTLMFSAKGNLSLSHDRLDYFQDARAYPASRTWHPVPMTDVDVLARVSFGKNKVMQRAPMTNDFIYLFKLTPTTPDMLHMVDVVNDSDPLNIYLGNPALKVSYQQSHDLTYMYRLPQHQLTNTAKVTALLRHNDLVRGYTYDSSTGVRRFKTYNVNGNYDITLRDNLSWQFGSRKQFMLSSETAFSFLRYANMIGMDTEEPDKSVVDSRIVTQNIGLDWQLGKQTLRLKGGVTDRRTSSSADGIGDITATHYNYGVMADFVLPAGFGLSTDFTCYTRRGYGSSQLDTTDPIWNLRLTYSPARSWVIMFDSFDMLHKLSNVNYAVDAAGRTISVTNTLPRYMLLSVQYRFSMQPKSAKGKPSVGPVTVF